MITIKKYSKVLLHVLAWVIVFLVPLFFIWIYSNGKIDEKGKMLGWLNAATMLFWITLFYLNSEILIPRLLYKKRYGIFILLQLVSFVIILGFHGILFKYMIDFAAFNFFKSSWHNFAPFLFAVLTSIVYRTVSDRLKAEAIESERQKEHLKTELSFLRSQISPHFLFNVMNNLVAMARLKKEDLEPTIVKLSSLMQYMLYNTDEEKVLLKSEVDYLHSYIDLQKMRFGKNLQLNVAIDPVEDWHTIEPMLLIPFVENAFKHGTGAIQNPVIDILLTAEHDQLIFTVRNKYNAGDDVKDRSSGIGLVNVERRLELLYGNRQQLKVLKGDGVFTVTLKLNFSK